MLLQSTEAIMQDVPIDLAQYAREESAIAISSSKLQEMYIQLRKLRDTVPSLIRPMQSTSRSPEIIYAEFAKAAAGAVNSTQDFATLMKTKTCQDILLQTRRSRLNDDEGISSWLSDEHEDWLDKPSLVGMKKELDNDAEHMDMAPNLTMEQAIDAFKEAHIGTEPSISLTENEILYSHLPADILFRIQIKDISHQPIVYSVTCQRISGSTKQSRLHTGINQALSHRPRQFDLLHTLRLLKSYSDVTSRPCFRCHRLTDVFGQFPVSRQQEPHDQGDQFEAFHEGCVAE